MYACTALFLCSVKNAVLPTHMCTVSVGNTTVANTGRHGLQNTSMIAKYDKNSIRLSFPASKLNFNKNINLRTHKKRYMQHWYCAAQAAKGIRD